MKINSFRGPNRGDIAGIDEKLERILDIYNKPLEEHTAALKSSLNIDNENAEIRELQVYHNTLITVTLNKIEGKCIGAIHLWNSISDYCTGVIFNHISDTQISIKFYFSTTPTAKLTVRVYLKGE